MAVPPGAAESGGAACMIRRKSLRLKPMPSEALNRTLIFRRFNFFLFSSKFTGRDAAAVEEIFRRTAILEIPTSKKIAGIDSMEMESAINLTVLSVTTLLDL